MILVTGAAGKTGQAVIRALIGKGVRVRALAYREAQVNRLLDIGAREVVVGNLLDPKTVVKATREASAIYHICPNVHPEEYQIGRLMIDAARLAGCKQFVYHSVLHPQTEAMPHHWSKMRVEEYLFTSGLPYTILQPAPYMQNILAGWEGITREGIYTIPYAMETRIGMVDLNDVAAAGARVLTEPIHSGATYELSGTEILSQIEIASQLSSMLRRTIKVKVISTVQWKEMAQQKGLEAYQVETLIKMFTYYERHHFPGNANTLNWLLGRKPATFQDFLLQRFRKGSTFLDG